MNGTSWDGNYALLPQVPVQWSIAATGDFTVDRVADIVWQNTSTGDRSIWFMSGNSWAGGYALLPQVSTEWSIAGVGDFNADRRPDLVWQNTTTGDRSIWFMNGATWTGAYALLPQVSPEWSIVAVGDFNIDGMADFVWQNISTGQRSIWFMNGSTWNGAYALLPDVPNQWRIVAAADFDEDGYSDLVWQNISSGDRSIWLMNGSSWQGRYSLLPTVPTAWGIAGVMPSLPGQPYYSIGGGVTGLSGTLVLQNNGADDLTVTVNGAFTFATPAPSGGSYDVRVKTQPVGQGCVVAHGAGSLTDGGINNVAVACSPATSSIYVVRVGDGSSVLSPGAVAVYLEERNYTSGALLNTVGMPTAAAGSNRPFTLSGSAVSEGALSLSADRRFVALAGYDAVPGTASVSGTTASAIPRVVGRVDASGVVETSTRTNTAFSATNVRAATTVDGNSFWVTGGTSGVHYLALGAAASTQIAAIPANLRHAHIFGGQLFVSSGSAGSATVLSVGTGTPTTSGQTSTALPGLPTTGGSPNSFAILSAAVTAGNSVLYLSQDATPATNTINVQKWVLNGTTWSQQVNFHPTLVGVTQGTRGLAAFVTPTGEIRIVATTNDSRLVTFVDDGLDTPLLTILVTAGANSAYRGVAAAPVP